MPRMAAPMAPLAVGDIMDEDDEEGGGRGPDDPADRPAAPTIPDPDGKLAKWIEFARKKFARHCKLVADPGPFPPLSLSLSRFSSYPFSSYPLE